MASKPSTTFVIILSLGFLAVAAQGVHIDSDVFENLGPGKTVLVHFKRPQEFTDATKVGPAENAKDPNRVPNTLQAIADAAQGPVIALLKQRQAAAPTLTWFQLWINNQLAVTGADKALIHELERFPEIERIEADKIVAGIHG